MSLVSVQEHYDRHLGPVYAWMAGGIDSAMERGAAELDGLDTTPSGAGVAVDLGAGFGMHAIPLARRGFNVLAIDSCAALLGELRAREDALPITTVVADLQSFPQHLPAQPELVLCMGDTLSHLADKESVERLFRAVSTELTVGGRFVMTFRDYSVPLTAEKRFIPVRNDENRIFTCFLEYGESRVTVHDMLYQRDGAAWTFTVSAYPKLRLAPDWLVTSLRNSGFAVERKTGAAGMVCLVAQRV